MRFALTLGLFGMLSAAMAFEASREATAFWWGVVFAEAYLAVCCFSIAIAYGLREAGVDVESLLSHSRWSPLIRVAMLPYLIVAAMILYVSRRFDRDGLLNEVVPRLYIGRFPFPSENDAIRRAGIQAILNLCWEFPGISGVHRSPDIETAHLPILDGVPPTDLQFDEAVRRVSLWMAEGRCILVHCAQGHGRSSSIVAACLVRLGVASDADHALEMIRAARRGAKPSGKQYEALNRYVSRVQ